MNTNNALFAACLTLVACTNSEPESAPQGQTPPAAHMTDAQPTNDSPPSVDDEPCPAMDAGTGMVKAPKPTDRCDGLYNCETDRSRSDRWLHSDGVSCFLDGMILEPDGRVLYSDGTEYGTWKGDDKIFDVTDSSNGGYICHRK